MKSIRILFYAFAFIAFLSSCERYEEIAGEYDMHFTFHFTGPGFYGDVYNESQTITITQDEGNITVDGVPGELDTDGNIRITGSLVYDGTQTFNGSVDKNSGVITGSLSGLAEIDIWSGYSYNTYSATITTGTCTFTPVD